MSGKSINTSATRIEAMQLQSSAYGVTIPLIYGVTRTAGNVVWYGGFKAIAHTDTQGGKGGVKVQNTTYSYQASVAMGLGHGPIAGVPRVWRGKKLHSGDINPSQVVTTTETYTVPGSGPMVYTVSHAADWLALVSASITNYTTTEAGIQYAWDVRQLSLGTEISAVGGVVTVLKESLRGATITIRYQWANGTVNRTALDSLGLTFKSGEVAQAPWSALATYGSQELGYSGLALVCGQDYDLGTGAQVENHLFEVVAPLAYHLGPTIPDVDLSLVVRDVLLNGRYGAGFPAASVDGWTRWSDWCVAAGLLCSPLLDKQETAASVLEQAARLTNSGIVWSEGKLKMVPYADSDVTGNGRTYTANNTPVYELTDDCWSRAPVGRQKSSTERYNHWRVRYRDRGHEYNDAIAEVKDQADIDAFGLRPANLVDAPWICEPAVARQVGQLLMQSSLHVVNEYEGRLPWHFALLEPTDLNLITDPALQLAGAAVRITKIEEDDKGELAVTFEDHPAGVSTAAIYPAQAALGYVHDYNVAPGNVDTPVIFEAPADLTTTGLEVYAAVRGTSANWGGCQVWVSLDGTNYKQVGTVFGGARYGTLAGSMGSTVGVQGLGAQQLLSGTATEASKLQTLCWATGLGGQEYFAYETATLTGAGAYTLGGLVRAAYGTSALTHSTGNNFVRVDDRIAKSGPLDVALVGSTISFKFTSFNLFNAAQQALDDVVAHPYTITGGMAALRPGIAGKGVKLRASTLTFQYPKSGGVSPGSATLTAERKGTLVGGVTFSVVAGTAVLVGTGDARTIDPISMLTESITVRASVTDSVATYIDEITIVKVREGTDGLPGTDGAAGQRGSLATSRQITGTSWIDSEADAAIAALGVAAPITTDLVTLYNAAGTYSETRVRSAGAWITYAARVNGNLLVLGTITTDKLVVGSVTESAAKDVSGAAYLTWPDSTAQQQTLSTSWNASNGVIEVISAGHALEVTSTGYVELIMTATASPACVLIGLDLVRVDAANAVLQVLQTQEDICAPRKAAGNFLGLDGIPTLRWGVRMPFSMDAILSLAGTLRFATRVRYRAFDSAGAAITPGPSIAVPDGLEFSRGQLFCKHTVLESKV